MRQKHWVLALSVLLAAACERGMEPTAIPVEPSAAVGVSSALTPGFERTWGGENGDNARGVAVGSDGSIYVTGITLSFGTPEDAAFLLKYAPDGTLLWQRIYSGQRSVVGRDVAVHRGATGGDAVYVTGGFFNSAFLARFDTDGNLVWQRSWGGDSEHAEAVAVAPDGSIYIAGGTNNPDFGAGGADMVLVKFGSDGSFVWDRTWGGPISELARDVAVAADGSVYVAGEGNSFFGNDAVLLKFAADGGLIWQRDRRTGGLNDQSAALGVATGADGSVYVTGAFLNFGVGQQVFLSSVTADGSQLWERTWGAQVDAGLDVAVGPDGRIHLTGNTGFGQGGSPAFGGDAFVVTFAPSGKVSNALTWGGAGNDEGQAIAVGPDGNVYVAGWAEAPPYVLERARKTTKPSDAVLDVPAGAVTAPNATVSIPNGVVTTVEGSQTFAGATDAVLVKIIP
jgi:serine-aspartate repeat-containing protein C/D/E